MLRLIITIGVVYLIIIGDSINMLKITFINERKTKDIHWIWVSEELWDR